MIWGSFFLLQNTISIYQNNRKEKKNNLKIFSWSWILKWQIWCWPFPCWRLFYAVQAKQVYLICIWILNPRELPSFCIWNYSRPNCLGSCKEVKYLACKCWYSISGFSLLQLSNTNTNIFKSLSNADIPRKCSISGFSLLLQLATFHPPHNSFIVWLLTPICNGSKVEWDI